MKASRAPFAAALACTIFATASPAFTREAQVRSGEHPEFTRIVVEGTDLGAWKFGRTADGYELQSDASDYDLDQAFARIPRDRVSAIWRDDSSGRLRLGLSCDCHAIAFEYQPGMIVVDIKPGAAPSASGFEQSLDRRPERGPAPGGYDWLASRQPNSAPNTGLNDPVLADLVEDNSTLNPLRDALMMQISRGVAEGVVQLVQKPHLPSPGNFEIAEAEGLRITVGDMPGITTDIRDQTMPQLPAGTALCIADDRISAQNWLPPGDVALIISAQRNDIMGEFDKADREGVLRAVRFHLSIGFGAEARQYLALLPGDDPEAKLLRSMTWAADLLPSPDNPFQGMEACDGMAVFWASLMTALRGDMLSAATNTEALARSFSSLPRHLRQNFGPVLVQALTRRGDEDTARRIRDATLRGHIGPAAPVTLMDAQFQLAVGDEVAAADLAAEVMAGPGTLAPEAAVTIAKSAFAGSRQVPEALPDQLAAFLSETRHTALEPEIRYALILAEAMSGDFETAFAVAQKMPQALGDLWVMASQHAPDDLFLVEAITALKDPSIPPKVGRSSRFRIASRLFDAGFADQSLAWLEPLTPDRDEAHRMLIAKAHLYRRDARSALREMAGLEGAEADRMRAVAGLQLGDALTAEEAFTRLGDRESALAARIRRADWADVAATAQGPWRDAASAVLRSEASVDTGSLAHSAELLSASSAARDAVRSLLDSLPAPSP